MLFRVPYKSPFLKEIRISMEKSTSIYAIPCCISKEILEPCFLLSLQQLIDPNKINNNPAITVAHFPKYSAKNRFPTYVNPLIQIKLNTPEIVAVSQRFKFVTPASNPPAILLIDNAPLKQLLLKN